MRLLGYECKTTFWNDFSIAERFGEKEIRDTYRRARAEWERDRVYGTELSMVLNHKCWYWYEKNDTFSKLYAELWEEYHDWVLENWKSEDLGYYLRVTDQKRFIRVLNYLRVGYIIFTMTEEQLDTILANFARNWSDEPIVGRYDDTIVIRLYTIKRADNVVFSIWEA